MAKRWDTPTDGISRKQFDRAMDSHIRRYTILAQEIAEIRLAYKAVVAMLAKYEDVIDEN